MLVVLKHLLDSSWTSIAQHSLSIWRLQASFRSHLTTSRTQVSRPPLSSSRLVPETLELSCLGIMQQWMLECPTQANVMANFATILPPCFRFADGSRSSISPDSEAPQTWTNFKQKKSSHVMYSRTPPRLGKVAAAGFPCNGSRYLAKDSVSWPCRKEFGVCMLRSFSDADASAYGRNPSAAMAQPMRFPRGKPP